LQCFRIQHPFKKPTLRYTFGLGGGGGEQCNCNASASDILKSPHRQQCKSLLCQRWRNHFNCDCVHHRTYLNLQCHSSTITSSECQASQPIEHAPNPQTSTNENTCVRAASHIFTQNVYIYIYVIQVRRCTHVKQRVS